MSGRPSKIDPNAALEQAMLLFWEHGYSATSVAQLESALGAGRQSIYNTFGDKKSLFLKAYQHYLDTRLKSALALLKIDGSPQEKLRNLFLNSLDCTSEKHLGCFIGNSLATPASHQPEIEAITDRAIQIFISALSAAITPLFGSQDTKSAAAWNLLTLFQGTQLIAKQKNTRESLLTAINHHIDHLPSL